MMKSRRSIFTNRHLTVEIASWLLRDCFAGSQRNDKATASEFRPTYDTRRKTMTEIQVTDEEIKKLHDRLDREAEASGYHLNPDVDFTPSLVRGLLINEKRYGYWACPCRLAAGEKEDDLDIICPCDYRDADLNDYGQCYCALYVSEEVLRGEKEPGPIPERRPREEERARAKAAPKGIIDLPYPVWRCRACGYLCAKENPPGVCPICKAKKERFERFL